MSKQICGHESSVAMASYQDALSVCNADFDEFFDRCASCAGDLLDIGFVHCLRITDYRHRGVHEDSVALGQEQNRGCAAVVSKRVWRAANLPGGARVGVF